jgi:hypothetical protein
LAKRLTIDLRGSWNSRIDPGDIAEDGALALEQVCSAYACAMNEVQAAVRHSDGRLEFDDAKRYLRATSKHRLGHVVI